MSKMKAAILCGGLGTRLAEETVIKPKPMVEIGGYPILWHIMKGFAAHGVREFVLALGYKGEFIKDYFVHYLHRTRSLTVDIREGQVQVHRGDGDDWVVHLLDTGSDTQTGGRVKRVIDFIGEEPFFLTYGDGVANVDLGALLAFHQARGALATLTAVRPPARFGKLVLAGELVERFEEKPQLGEGWINGGFFVMEPGVARYIEGDTTLLEKEPLEKLAGEQRLAAYRHPGFWQCMDTLRDVRYLEQLWQQGHPPWKTW